MKAGRVVVIILGVAFLAIAAIYLISPQLIGGPPQEGEMLPQYSMPGKAVTATFTTIPLGIGELVVPVVSAVAIFAIMGIALVFAGVATAKGKEEAG